MSIEQTLWRFVETIIRAAVMAFIRRDTSYLKRAAADATAYEAEKKLIEAAKRRARR